MHIQFYTFHDAEGYWAVALESGLVVRATHGPFATEAEAEAECTTLQAELADD